MTGKDMILGMNHIDAAYIQEAALLQGRKYGTGHWRRWCAAAACFALILTMALSVIPGLLQGTNPLTPGDDIISGPVIDAPDPSNPPENEQEEAPSTVYLRMSGIHLNEMTLLDVDSALLFDPGIHERVSWDQEQVIAYLSRDFAPAYVPSNLVAAEGNGTASVVREINGPLIRDVVGYSFYTGYDEYGLPEHELGVHTGFSLDVSKMGVIERCCLYLLPDSEVKTTDIGGVPVTIGCREMTHGPYDPETKEPAGYYDVYVASFELDGVTCELISEQMELEEVVKVLASIICETDDIVLED